VLLHDPELLLLDEPASGLDPRARIEVREILKELSRMGKTILISSHILHELSQLCTRIGILEAGTLLTEGSLEEIYHRLGLMQLVHVQVVSGPQELATHLGSINGVESVEVQADRLSIRVRAELLPPEDLLDHIREFGARVRMFQPEAMELETAFMKLTQGTTA
jgi:ABC-2 type transport system ATP-binding protein